MTKTQELLELAERCEQASGQDRGLERELEQLFGALIPFRDLAGRLVDQPEWDGSRAATNSKYVPFFTASIDAALTLVPEGWTRWIYDADEGRCICRIERDDESLPELEVGSNAATWPLALCAAALRARSQS